MAEGGGRVDESRSAKNASEMSAKDIEMETTAQALVAPGKGILAADESTGTIEKRLKSVSVPSTEETRRDYREMLFRTPGLNEFISGIILFDETLRQRAADGTPLVEVLRQQGIIPGIKVDKGAKPLAGFPGEKTTEGLDGLRSRLEEYATLGAKFTKWRAVIRIGAGIPTRPCLEANAHALARFAALSQEAGLMPIVEPEVLMDGDHGIQRHFEVTEAALKRVFHALFEFGVRLESLLLKPNMVLSGSDNPEQASVSEAADLTLRCLRRGTPAAVPGIMFLSGGQSDVRATEHLNAINQLGKAPWELSFSFGRALQAPAISAWAGNAFNIQPAQRALYHRARCNSAARAGKYSADLEKQTK
jgi:fructose-bisphosphate aldolase, class I